MVENSEASDPSARASRRCLPDVASAKPKLSRTDRLQGLLQDRAAPSVLAAGTMHLCRRYLLGMEPANSLERVAFRRLANSSNGFREIVSCALNAFDDLPAGLREQLFDASIYLDPTQPLTPEILLESGKREVISVAGSLVHRDAEGLEVEVAGQIRMFDPGNSEQVANPVRISRINELRTEHFLPSLSAGDWLPEEIQQVCTIEGVEEGNPELICQVMTSGCPGNSTDGVCLRVQEIAAGDSVLLEGVNFFSVDTTVRLTLREPIGAVPLEVPSHVRGDLETPLTEVIGGDTFLVLDSRVRDRLTFEIPADLLPGVYEVRVIVPNVSGIAVWGGSIASDPEYIAVQLPDTSRFEIFADSLYAAEETSPQSLGSDEIGLKFLPVAVLADGTFTPVQDVPVIRFGNVDSGDTRDISSRVFAHNQAIAAFAVAVLGHEVDSEGAYSDELEEWTEVFVELVKDQWGFLAGLLGSTTLSAALDLAGKMPPLAWIALAAALLLVLAVDALIALWAPADPVIKDGISMSAIELAQLTSPDFPLPGRGRYEANDDISVLRQPLDKLPTQYREERRYFSEDQESEYHLRLRYNRVL